MPLRRSSSPSASTIRALPDLGVGRHRPRARARRGDGLTYANRAVEIARERALVTTLPFALQAQAAG